MQIDALRPFYKQEVGANQLFSFTWCASPCVSDRRHRIPRKVHPDCGAWDMKPDFSIVDLCEARRPPARQLSAPPLRTSTWVNFMHMLLLLCCCQVCAVSPAAAKQMILPILFQCARPTPAPVPSRHTRCLHHHWRWARETSAVGARGPARTHLRWICIRRDTSRTCKSLRCAIAHRMSDAHAAAA